MTELEQPYGRSYYDKIGFRYLPNSPRNHKRLEAILDHKQSGRLLEIGCGTGDFLKLAQDHFQVEGVDISTYAVEASQMIFGNRVRRLDIESQPIGAQQFDVVVAFNVLEHLSVPQKVIGTIHRALKPGGILIGSVPHNAGFLGKIHTTLTNIFDRTHQSTYRPDRWRNLFQHQCFRDIHFFGEILFGRNCNWYLRSQGWRKTAFNLMFVCEK